MGLIFGIGVGIIINVVLLYFVARNFFVGNRKLAFAFLSIFLLFSVVTLYIYAIDNDKNILYIAGLAPIYFVFMFMKLGSSFQMSLIISVLILSLPFLLLSFNFKTKEIEGASFNTSSRRLHYTHLFEVIVVGFLIVLTGILSWKFWLSPENNNSPLLSRYSVESTPTSFYKDWMGNVYAFVSTPNGWSYTEKRVDLKTTDEDFTPVSRHWAISGENIYNTQTDSGALVDVSHLDPQTFRFITDEYVSDKNGVYWDTHNKVEEVKDPSKFRPLESAETLSLCGSGTQYACSWYQDDDAVYYQGSKVMFADPHTFVLTDQSRGKDATYSYYVDYDKVSRPDRSKCVSTPCISTIPPSDLRI
jgi:hypothetical protein